MLFVDILPRNFVYYLLTQRISFLWNFEFFTSFTFRDCKKKKTRIFHPNTKYENFGIEEVLIEKRNSID